jgi:hypothetical protein
MELSEIRSRREELLHLEKQIEAQKIQALTLKREELSQQMKTIDNTLKTLNPSTRKRGKGFDGININDLILENVKPQGTRMTEIIKSIISSHPYDGKQQSIITSISSTLSKLVKSGKLQKVNKGIYASK